MLLNVDLRLKSMCRLEKNIYPSTYQNTPGIGRFEALPVGVSNKTCIFSACDLGGVARIQEQNNTSKTP